MVSVLGIGIEVFTEAIVRLEEPIVPRPVDWMIRNKVI
jgi:hypothetical protein